MLFRFVAFVELGIRFRQPRMAQDELFIRSYSAFKHLTGFKIRSTLKRGNALLVPVLCFRTGRVQRFASPTRHNKKYRTHKNHEGDKVADRKPRTPQNI